MWHTLLAFIAIHLATTFATQSIPFKCFVQEPGIENDFNQISRSDVSPSKKFLQFDHVIVKSINIDEDGFQFHARDVEVRGIEDSILDAMNFDFESNVIRMRLHMDILKGAHYKVNGSIFLLPIEGEGIWNETLKNLQIYMVCPFDIEEANGEKILNLKSYTYWYDVRDYTRHRFTNLYYGNKELSDSMHSLINENWTVLSLKYGAQFCNPFVKYIFNELKDYLQAMPLRDFSKC